MKQDKLHLRKSIIEAKLSFFGTFLLIPILFRQPL